MEKEATKILTDENAKLEFEVLARLVNYMESHYDFFEEASGKMQAMLPEIQEYRFHVDHVSVYIIYG